MINPSSITPPTLVISACAVVVTLVLLAVWRRRTTTRFVGRHRQIASRRLLPTDTDVTAVMNHRAWCGIVERRTTGTDRNSGVAPVRFPLDVRLMYADDVMVAIDSSVVGAL